MLELFGNNPSLYIPYIDKGGFINYEQNFNNLSTLEAFKMINSNFDANNFNIKDLYPIILMNSDPINIDDSDIL